MTWYLLGKSLNTYDHEFLEGYKSGGYVAIIAEK